MGVDHPSAPAEGIAEDQDLLAALRLTPGGEDAFNALSADERFAYAEWLDRATSPEHRARRVRLLVALITRAGLNDTGDRRTGRRGGGRAKPAR